MISLEVLETNGIEKQFPERKVGCPYIKGCAVIEMRRAHRGEEAVSVAYTLICETRAHMDCEWYQKIDKLKEEQR